MCILLVFMFCICICSPRYITPEEKLLILLRFMAAGSMQVVVADIVGVSQTSVSRILPEVCMALLQHLRTFIRMPETAHERQEAAARFYEIAEFPRTIGAIDCTHVKIDSPGGHLVCIYLVYFAFAMVSFLIRFYFRSFHY